LLRLKEGKLGHEVVVEWAEGSAAVHPDVARAEPFAQRCERRDLMQPAIGRPGAEEGPAPCGARNSGGDESLIAGGALIAATVDQG
jgi:hypothetical protein